MSEPKIIIYNSMNEKIAYSKFGVMWRIKPSERLGEFFNNQIFNHSKKQLGYLSDAKVFSMNGSELGEIKNSIFIAECGTEFKAKTLFKDGIEIGKCFPEDVTVAAMGLVLLGNELN